MFGLRKTLGSLFMVVAFLALAALATFFYNADQAQKNELVNNDFVKKGEEAFGTLASVSEKMTEVNVEKNIGIGKTMADFIGRTDWRGMITGASTKPLDNEFENLETSEINYNEVGFETTSVDADQISGTEKNFWDKISATIAEEWQKGRELETETAETINNPFGRGALTYQKTDLGAEVIISSKSGNEYKFPLPLKFLSK